MPTYEYACKACGEHLEVVQSFRDEPLTACAACGGPLRKVFGSIGIAFKGSGFYKTDSRGDTGRKRKPESASADGDAAAPKGDAGAKTDTAAGKGDAAKAKGDSPSPKSDTRAAASS